MQAPEKQQAIVAQIDAIGALKQYLHLQGFFADQARKSMVYAEQVREELAQEA